MPRSLHYLLGLFTIALFFEWGTANRLVKRLAAAEREETLDRQHEDSNRLREPAAESAVSSPIDRLQKLLATGGTLQWDDNWGYLQDLLGKLIFWHAILSIFKENHWTRSPRNSLLKNAKTIFANGSWIARKSYTDVSKKNKKI